MITKEQEQQIIDYLILQKLPVDILLEIKDHMISQVSDIQEQERLSFDEALLKAQKLWEGEFKKTHYSLFFTEEIPIIVKKIVKEKYNAIVKKALLLGIFSFGINLLLIFLSADQEMYSDLFRLYNSFFVLIPFLVWAFNAKMRKYIKHDFKYKGRPFYTIYQYNLGLLIVCVNIFQVILREDPYTFNYFRTEHQVAPFPLLISLLAPFILQVMIIFILINFFEHKKSLYKMQDFLNMPIE